MEQANSNEPKVHTIKCWREAFRPLAAGLKTFEWRKDDRGYQVGDILFVREWDEVKKAYTSKFAQRVITYKMAGGWFGIPEDYCILGLDTLDEWFDRFKEMGLDPMDKQQIRAAIAMMR